MQPLKRILARRLSGAARCGLRSRDPLESSGSLFAAVAEKPDKDLRFLTRWRRARCEYVSVAWLPATRRRTAVCLLACLLALRVGSGCV